MRRVRLKNTLSSNILHSSYLGLFGHRSHAWLNNPRVEGELPTDLQEHGLGECMQCQMQLWVRGRVLHCDRLRSQHLRRYGSETLAESVPLNKQPAAYIDLPLSAQAATFVQDQNPIRIQHELITGPCLLNEGSEQGGPVA